MKNKKDYRYEVIDHKKGTSETYSSFAWNIAFVIIFGFGVFFGLVIGL